MIHFLYERVWLVVSFEWLNHPSSAFPVPYCHGLLARIPLPIKPAIARGRYPLSSLLKSRSRSSLEINEVLNYFAHLHPFQTFLKSFHRGLVLIFVHCQLTLPVSYVEGYLPGIGIIKGPEAQLVTQSASAVAPPGQEESREA